MPRALITGATGFIGSALLRELLQRGWEVRVLHRPHSDLRNLEGHFRPFERWVGDLRVRQGLSEALRGCDALFHVAARYQFSIWGGREMYLDNVEGTRNILRAAAERGVKRYVVQGHDEGYLIHFSVEKPGFGLRKFDGEYEIQRIDEQNSLVRELLFIDSSLPLVNASAKDLQNGLTEDAAMIRAWIGRRLVATAEDDPTSPPF
ncbi:MAG: NAD-dependent epimerase/dehydratase family protein [Planctomycetes bacterium]|nr:NAD-dependent epimerase/dehydratase family protein [Planctomycetota bacterium]